MLKQKPKFSVIMALKGELKGLKEAVVQVLQQSFVDFELLVVGRQSSERLAAFNDPRLFILPDNSDNLAALYNRASAMIRGQYVLYLTAQLLCNCYCLQVFNETFARFPTKLLVSLPIKNLSSMVLSHKSWVVPQLGGWDERLSFLHEVELVRRLREMYPRGLLTLSDSLISAQGSLPTPSPEDWKKERKYLYNKFRRQPVSFSALKLNTSLFTGVTP